MTFVFSYDEFVDGYYHQLNNKKYFDATDDVVCFMIKSTKKYETASKKQKKNDSLPKLEKDMGYLGAFVKQHIAKDCVRRLKFIDETKVKPNGILFYPMGIYVMMDLDKRKRSSNVYFVFPTIKKNDVNQSIVSGDHYSFMYDTNDEKHIHLHFTGYVPYITDINIGFINHGPRNYFPDLVELPIAGFECSVFNDMSIFKDDILELCRFPSIVDGDLEGGAKHRHKNKAQSRNTSGDISRGLEKALLRKEVKNVFAVGYKHEDRWHMTVDFTWVEQEEEDDENSESETSEDYVDDGRHPMAFVIEHPTFASFQAELTRRLVAQTN